MKNLIFSLIFGFIFLAAQGQEKTTYFVIETPYGNMKGFLYNETKQHRDNFVKLVKEGWYNESPWHRIIKDFMIQGGGNKDGRTDPGYTVPAEFMAHKYYHKKGALSAARMGDNVNPTKASSGSQFYIVQGKVSNDAEIAAFESRITQSMQDDAVREFITRPENKDIFDKVNELQKARKTAELNAYSQQITELMKAEGIAVENFKYTEQQKTAYKTIGGTPHLDGGYTVFGEITEGFDVLDKLASVPTGKANMPIDNVTMKIKIVEK